MSSSVDNISTGIDGLAELIRNGNFTGARKLASRLQNDLACSKEAIFWFYYKLTILLTDNLAITLNRIKLTMQEYGIDPIELDNNQKAMFRMAKAISFHNNKDYYVALDWFQQAEAVWSECPELADSECRATNKFYMLKVLVQLRPRSEDRHQLACVVRESNNRLRRFRTWLINRGRLGDSIDSKIFMRPYPYPY